VPFEIAKEMISGEMFVIGMNPYVCRVVHFEQLSAIDENLALRGPELSVVI